MAEDEWLKRVTTSVYEKIGTLSAETASAIALRVGLRALPLCTLGQGEPDELALLRTFRGLHYLWTSMAYGPFGEGGWSEPRLGVLQHLWSEGRTASEIALFLGGVSRNAVIGKAHRLGLSSRPAPAGAGPLDLFLPSKKPYLAGEVQQHAYETISIIYGALTGRGSNQKTPQTAAREAVSSLLDLSDRVSPIYTSYAPRYLLSAIDDDVAMYSSHSAKAVLYAPLWKPSPKPPSIATPRITGAWTFWKKWYASRRRGGPPLKLSRAISAGLDHEVALIPNAIWEAGALEVAAEISKISKALNQGDASTFAIFPEPPSARGLEKQNLVAAIFKNTSDDIIDVDERGLSGRALADDDATDRHREVVDSAQDIVNLFQRFGVGANQAEPLVQKAERLIEALGASPSKARPGLVIPRGERLRQILRAQKNPDDLGADPPLPAPFLANLDVLVAAYNVYVAFDPFLAKRDEAQLGPDFARRPISVAEGAALIDDAVTNNIATEDVRTIIGEDAAVAPPTPDPMRRETRRYSEAIRNFVRVAIGVAFKPLKVAWENRNRVAAIAKASGKFARWVESHSESLLSYFGPESTMYNIIEFIAQAVRKWR